MAVKEKKLRPCAIDEIRDKLSPEQDKGLLEIANRHNFHLIDIQAYLRELGYKVSVNAVSTWNDRYNKEGGKAKKLNEQLEEYRGLDERGILEKMLADTITEIDGASLRAFGNTANIDDCEYLKALPNLRRAAVQAIETFNRLGQLRDKQELEKAGAYRMAQGLKEVFKDSPFEIALEQGIKSVLIEIEGG